MWASRAKGTIPRHEWDDNEEPPSVGDIVKVLIEEMEDELGLADDPYGMVSSAAQGAEADRVGQRDELVSEGQVVTGTVTRKIKGGLLVDIGVNVFLPASQVDIRRPPDIGDFIGRVVQCEVLKIDEARRNIVVSRRSLIEKQRKEDRERLLEELEEGRSARASSRTSPNSARSSTWAASTGCCTSPT
jgi:small subunit ribosomal protein S1